MYELSSGELKAQITGDALDYPVQLLMQNDVLYIGSSQNKSVVTYDMSDALPSGVVAPKTFITDKISHISGMGFDDEGNFYAAERKNKRILRFPSDGNGDGKVFIEGLPDFPEFILFVKG